MRERLCAIEHAFRLWFIQLTVFDAIQKGDLAMNIRTHIRKAASLALIVAFLAAFAIAPALAAAETFTSNSTFDTTLYVFVPCANGGAGEYITVSGPLHVLSHWTLNGAGGFQLKTLYQPQGISGYGAVSGDKYQATGGTQDISTGNVGFTYAFVNNFRMIGQGPGNNFMVHENYHYTVNANGTLTAYVDNYRVSCQ
jgi:hypothetical protein